MVYAFLLIVHSDVFKFLCHRAAKTSNIWNIFFHAVYMFTLARNQQPAKLWRDSIVLNKHNLTSSPAQQSESCCYKHAHNGAAGGYNALPSFVFVFFFQLKKTKSP